jgi:FkbM family methyltransferase
LATKFITKGEIHSFEPNPKIFKLLKENSFDNNIFLNEVALSYQTGEAEFYNREVVRHSGGSSLIKHSHFKKYKTIKVKTITLDEYILDHKPPTIMKIDVEGGEPFVLKGALRLLQEYGPTIIIEFLPDDLHREAVDILLNNGYKVFRIKNDGSLVNVNERDLFKDNITQESNYVFKKVEKNENLPNYKKQILFRKRSFNL